MPSFDGLMIRKLLRRGIVKQVGTNTPVALRIRYKGAGSPTSVVVTTGTNVVLTDSVTGAVTFTFASYTTMGALADAINGSVGWECKILDALRTDASVSKLTDGAVTSSVNSGITIWDLTTITANTKQFAVCFSYDRGFSKPIKLVQAGHVVKLLQARYFATLGGVAAGNFLVVERKGAVETTIYSALSVSASDTKEIDFTGTVDANITSDTDIVVVLKDGVTLADNAANFLRVIGQLE